VAVHFAGYEYLTEPQVEAGSDSFSRILALHERGEEVPAKLSSSHRVAS